MRTVRVLCFAILTLFVASASLFAAGTAAPAAPTSPGTDQAEPPLARIAMVDGSVTIMRDGAAIKTPDIGDPIYDDDYLSTGPGSDLTLDLLPVTGMKGSLTLKASTSLYLRMDILKGQAQNSAELITGQVALKVKKLAGSPTLQVTSATMVCGVRGTEFEVSSSAGGNTLVACTEGQVSCQAGIMATSAIPGQIVERRGSWIPGRRAVSAKDMADYKARWLAAEDKAFKAQAAKVAKAYIQHYLQVQKRLEGVKATLARDTSLMAWADQRKRGQGHSLDEVRRMRVAIQKEGRNLAQARALFGEMERAEVRVAALQKAIEGEASGLLDRIISPGYTVGDFFAQFTEMRSRDLGHAQEIRRSVKLYRLRMNLLEAHSGEES